MNVTEEIKSRLDIVNIVGATVQLRRTGKNYKGLCPFHDEKTPSFIVFPETGTWRCFGCGRGGDLFTYVMEREGWEFSEALRNLASMAGVQLEQVSPRQQEVQEKSDRLLRILADAADFFTRSLLESEHAVKARQYIEKRGLGPATIQKFAVGYAPDSWDALGNYLARLGHDPQDITDSGLLVIRDDGHTYDRFRDRLTIAIRDPRGRIVGFGARGLTKEATPKYINSPQSEIFDKSRLLYGFPEARRSIRELDAAVIVEGYMDVMQAHQAGFENVVAQMGTALTEAQLNLISRYTNHIILALDPDAAGQMATTRGHEVIERVTQGAALEAAREGVWGFDEAEGEHRARLSAEIDARGIVRYKTRTGFDIRVVVLPEGMDPDDLIRENPGEWARLIQDAMPVIDYTIQRIIADKNLADPAIKTDVAGRIVPLINELPNPVERTHYRQYLARLLRVDERTFFPEAAPRGGDRNGRRKGYDQSPKRQQRKDAPLASTPTFARETYCLAAILQHPYMLYEFNRVLGQVFDVSAMPEMADVSWEVLPDYLNGMLVAEDFASMQNRMVYQLWLEALAQETYDPVEYLTGSIDDETRGYLDTLLGRPLAAIGREGQPVSTPETDDTMRERTLKTLLALREQRIDGVLRELTFILGESEEGSTDPGLQKMILILMAARRRLANGNRFLTGRNHEIVDN